MGRLVASTGSPPPRSASIAAPAPWRRRHLRDGGSSFSSCRSTGCVRRVLLAPRHRSAYRDRGLRSHAEGDRGGVQAPRSRWSDHSQTPTVSPAPVIAIRNAELSARQRTFATRRDDLTLPGEQAHGVGRDQYGRPGIGQDGGPQAGNARHRCHQEHRLHS